MKRIGRLIFSGAGILGLVFCSRAPSKSLSLSPGFVFSLREEVRLEYDGETSGGLQAAGGNIYFSTKKGTVYAVDGAAKKIAWQFAAKAAVLAAPSVCSERIVFADKENNIYCLGLDGTLRWKKKFEESVSGGIVQDSGKAFLIMNEVNLVVLDAAHGNEVWRFKAASAIRTSPVFWNRQIICATAEGKLHFLPPPGQSISTYKSGAAVAGPLFIDQNRLYFSQEDGTFQCLELTAKKNLWKIKTGGFLTSLPAVDEKRIFLRTSNHVLFCLRKKSGILDWWRSLSWPAPYSPTVGDGLVFIAALSPVLTAFKKETGERAGTYDAGNVLQSAPLCLGGCLVISTFNLETSKGALVFLKGRAPEEGDSKKK